MKSELKSLPIYGGEGLEQFLGNVTNVTQLVSKKAGGDCEHSASVQTTVLCPSASTDPEFHICCPSAQGESDIPLS